MIQVLEHAQDFKRLFAFVNFFRDFSDEREEEMVEVRPSFPEEVGKMRALHYQPSPLTECLIGTKLQNRLMIGSSVIISISI